MHDDGGTAEAIAEVFKESAQSIGAILVAPRAVYSAKGGGYRWGKGYEGDHVVMEALAYANSHYNIEPRRRVVAGYSQGGTIAMVSAYRNPYEFQGVIAIAPQYDSLFAPPPNPMRSAVPKYYLMVGAKDEALEDSRKYADEYWAMSLDVELEVHEGLGHEFPENLTAELQKALRFVLPR
jgi:predicted esterase